MNRPIKKIRATGVVNLDYFENKFVFNRFLPSENLRDLVDFYWSIQWELGEGESHTQEVVPHPAVNLTFLKDDSRITGISDKMYTHTLSGKGLLIGTKFCPAGFYPYAKNSNLLLSKAVDQRFNVERVFDIDAKRFENEVLMMEEPQDQIQKIEEEIFDSIPEYDEKIAFLNALVLQIEEDTTITSVAIICEQFEIGERQLQRLFSKYIGVSPKWVIRRYRLQKTLGRIENGETIVWRDLAVELGYYDQAHFIKDFKKFFGKNPVALHKAVKMKKNGED